MRGLNKGLVPLQHKSQPISKELTSFFATTGSIWLEAWLSPLVMASLRAVCTCSQ